MRAAVAFAATAAVCFGDDLRITTLEGKTIDQAPESIEDRALVTVEGTELDLSQLRRIDYGRRIVEAPVGGAPVRVDLAGGDVLFGRIAGSEAELERVLIVGPCGKIGIPYDRIDLLTIRTTHFDEPIPERREDEVEDTLFVISKGERATMSGAVKSFTDEKIRFFWKTADREGSISFAKVQALRCHVRTVDREPEGVVARFHLVDGTIVTGLEPELEDGTYRFELVEGGDDAEIAAGLVSRIDITSDLVRFLSDITPIEVIEHDFLGAEPLFPMQTNRSTSGRPISIKGSTHERGLGVHAYSKVTYDLRRRYRRFRSVVALDPEMAGDRGTVVFRVHGDDRVLFESGVVKVGDGPLVIDCDIEGVKFLRLEVDPADDLDFGDHALWASPMVIK